MDNGLAENFIAIWQSELTAMASDRELQENRAIFIQLWAKAAQAMAQIQPPHEHTPGSAVHTQPPWATPVNAASGAGMDEIHELNRRVAKLEQRLATLLEQQAGTKPTDDTKTV